VIDDPELPKVGLSLIDDQTARWCVWAPLAERVELVLGNGPAAQRVAMAAVPRGYHQCTTLRPRDGQRYAYALNEDAPVPDPYSRWQPDGVEGQSAVWFANRFAWDDAGWRGNKRQDLTFYELHVGTFTPEGTFEAIIPRIAELADLGINAIELMPVTQFPGTRGWGYDGVFPFAVQNSYGGPEALQRLVNACHQHAMAVFLDVIYNHFGPEGNVFPRFGPYLTDRFKTEWGAAVNYDGPGSDSVRAMVHDSARMWIRDFHIDGLRLDATDRIFDGSPRHILSEIAEVVHVEADRLGRTAHVFAETDLNDANRYLLPADRGGYAIDGYWNDDFHHAAHVALTGETSGYYVDFVPGPVALAKSFEQIFVNNGTHSRFRDRRHGAPADNLPRDRFLAFTQNHDQVGNRFGADRYAASLPSAKLRLAAGLLLLAPRLPLVFMGEEYGESNPFPFFCDFQTPELVAAVRSGRKAEFAHFGWTEDPPDAFAKATRDSAVLSWSWTDPVRAGLRQLYKDLFRLRRELPALHDFDHTNVRLLNDASVLQVDRGQSEPAKANSAIAIYFNLTATPQALPDAVARFEPILRSERSRYGATDATAGSASQTLFPHEFRVYSRVEQA
jgi:maltooligosyltrehalose trehalohydrolase